MVGAIIGDVAGSRFEFNNRRSKEFILFHPNCRPTDDSVMTLAVGQALMNCEGDWTKLKDEAVACMRRIGKRYPAAGYGGRFYRWLLLSDDPEPYNSYGNGAAMRVSAVGYVAKDMEEAKRLSRAVTEVTHNHPEGIKGAEATVACMMLAKEGKTIDEIRAYVNEHYYTMDFTLDEIRPTYRFNETCQQTVPQAIEAFLESTGYEDAIRNAISIGGDSDTLAAITGAIAGMYYGIPEDLREKLNGFMDPYLIRILEAFEAKYMS